MKNTHLVLGSKTRCGKWTNPEMWWTVSLAEVTCRKCFDAYRAELAKR